MNRRKEVSGLNIALLDILTGALGAVIILYVAVPKAKISKAKDSSESKVKKLKSKANEIAEKLIKEEKKVLELKNSLISLELKSKEEKRENESLKRELASLKIEKEKKSKTQVEEQRSYKGTGLPVDVGFKFKGKKIIFIIDISGSMYREDRIGQVKAGLKMLITSMPNDYHLDVIHFPGKNNKFFTKLWGGLRPLSTYHKNEIYKFLLKLRPGGFTPTREVLLDALKSYEETTDIVLLSDGAPTKGNSNAKENISSLLLEINKMNKENIRINTIGVGSQFIKRKGYRADVFLRELAKEHGGFFYGF